MKLYISDHNRVLADLRKHPDVEVTDLLSADAAVVWQDYRGLNRDIVMFCNSVGIPTLVMQHGGNQTREYLPPTDEVPIQFPLFASRVMVWGPADRDRLLKEGYGPERVILTGSTVFDHLPKREKHEGVNVVYFPLKWDVEIEENYALLRALLEPGKYNVVTKITREYFDVGKFKKLHDKCGGELVVTSPDAPGHLEAIYDLLRTADIFVLTWPLTTPSLLADCMDIPIVYADIFKPRTAFKSEKKYRPIASDDGDTVKDLSKLAEIIDYNLAHPEHRRVWRLETARRYANFGAGGKAIDRIAAAVGEAIEGARKDSVKNKIYSRLGPADARAMSESIIDVLEDKAERGFRTYADGLKGKGAVRILESAPGFPDEYVVADIPAGADYGSLPFSAENVVSAFVGKHSSRVGFDNMGAKVADGSVDVVFDTNYPRGISELEAKAGEYARVLKAGGELHMFLPNPGALKSRVKKRLGIEPSWFYMEKFPPLPGVMETMGKVGFKKASVESVHPWKLYIRAESAASRKKMKLIGTLYRLFRGLLPGSIGSIFVLVYRKGNAG